MNQAPRSSSELGPVGSPQLLGRLSRLCAERGLDDLAGRLLGLSEFVAPDLETVDEALDAIAPVGSVGESLVGRSANHLLEQGGKRLRPLCVALAARAGSGFSPAALDMAVAVELVHNATLLHDDVVDLANTRRGASTARHEYGNAASVFAGDWMLIEALRRVHRSGIPDTLEPLLATIEQMVLAESVQLEHRGRIDAGRDVYFQVAEGKTAALFRWAMAAGGKCGGLSPEQCSELEEYGSHLGVAFQVIDDLLDLTGDTQTTGKALFTDLREGKMTYPLILALERDAELRPVIERILQAGEGQSATDRPPVELCDRLIASLHRTGAVEDCRQLALERSHRAVRCLHGLPDGDAVVALTTVAEATVHRRR